MSSKKIQLFTFLLLLNIFLLPSCGTDQLNMKDLEGDWTTVFAKRNGKVTQTLDNVNFNFVSDSALSTNLFGETELFKGKYSYPVIEIESSKLKEINVLGMRGDTLLLFMRINQFRYDFELIRKTENH